VKILRGDYQTWQPVDGPTRLTIGVFDGVHRGHQSIIESLRAGAGGPQVGVITFAQHPLAFLRPEAAPTMLTSLEQRLDLLGRYGVDVSAVLDFPQVRAMSPIEFVETIVGGVMRASHVAVGRGFRFGHRMAGDERVLRDLGEEFGFTVGIVDIMGDRSPVSSTAIRQALQWGDVREAARMLGRPFQVQGRVVAGDGRGRHLGFPTANLEIDSNQALPAPGVYTALTRTKAGDRESYPSVVNIGTRPTFGGTEEVVETHLLDVTLNLYGRTVGLDFIEHIRDERRFDDVDGLVRQIGRDISTARVHFAGERP